MAKGKRSKWGLRLGRMSLCAGLLVSIAGTWSAIARAEEIDASIGQAPTLSPVAPVPKYDPALDKSNGAQSTPASKTTDSNSKQVEADIDTLGSNSLDYVALILDRDATDNLYIKVQGQSGNGKFSHVGFYHGLSVGGWTGMTGGPAFFELATTDQFATAHMTVIHDGAGNVTLRLTNIDGGGKVLEFTRGGWTPRNSSVGGFGGFAATYSIDNWGLGSPVDSTCDTFDRPNGTLGGNWVTTDGSGSIVSNSARGNNTSRSIFIGSCPGGIGQDVEADVSVVPTTLDYCALVLNYDGADNLYVKVQRQSGTAGTTFTHIGFYDSVNGLAWAGQTGGPSFFSIPADQQFQTAHMRVTVDGGGTVRLILTNIDGGTGLLEFQRGGWTFRNGDGAGFGGFAGSNVFDNWGTGGHICDFFNRANGPLGSQWTTIDGTTQIVSHAARGDSTSRSIFTGTCGACVDTTPPLVDITAPVAFACGCANVTISGSVSDPDGEYSGDILEYRAANAATWTLAGSASTPRTGTLYTWNTGALPEGYYFLRVTGTNECGLSASDTTLIYISRVFDTVDVRSPLNGAILGGSVCFDGTVWDNNCFDLYTVMYKPLGGGAFAPVDPAHLTYTTTVINDPFASWSTASGPTSVPDGDYQVRVRGVDDCGNLRDVIRTVTIDNTAPVASLSSALTCRAVKGVLQIVGTASDAHLAGWSVQYTGGDAHNWVTIASGNTSVINGVLANWDTTALRKCAYTIRLVVSDQANVNCSGFTHSAEDYASVGVGLSLLGDMNCDGLINFADINPFVACLTAGGNCSCP